MRIGSVNTEKIRWQYEVEPEWRFFVSVPTPTAANTLVGNVILQPNEIGYLYGYQVTVTNSNVVRLYYSISPDMAVPQWLSFPLVFSRAGTEFVSQKAPMGTVYPAYDITMGVPLAAVQLVAEAAEPLAGNYFQCGVLIAVMNKSEV